MHGETHDESDTGEDHPDEPESHDDGLFGPADGLEMMMEWCNFKNLFAIPEFLGGELDDDGADLEDVDTGDDAEDDECVGHHGDDTEIGAECERADVSHVELSGFDIEPEEGDEGSDDEHTDGGEDEKALIVGNEGVDDIIEEEESAGESVESVGDIDRIGHGDDDEDEEGNIEESDFECPEEGDTETGVSEFDIEPVGSKSGENHEEDHLESCRESLSSPDPANIKVIIYESDESDTREREESEIGLVSIPETVFDVDIENTLDIGCEKVDDYGDSDE